MVHETMSMKITMPSVSLLRFKKRDHLEAQIAAANLKIAALEEELAALDKGNKDRI